MKIEWDSCIKVGVSIFALYLCINYWHGFIDLILMVISAAFPLFVGAVIAYLVNILMSFYERLYFAKSSKDIIVKSRRPVCMTAAFITFITIALMIVRLVLPQLISCIQLILSQLPGFIEMLIKEVAELHILPEDIVKALSSEDWNSRIGDILKILTSGLGDIVNVIFKAVSKIFSVAVTALLSIIFSVYLLIGKDRLKRQCNHVVKHYLKKNWYKRVRYVAEILNDSFHSYIVGQCIEAVIIGVLCTLGMLVLDLPYATMIGALIAFTALIPVAGAYIGAIVGAFLIVMVSPIQAVIFLIFIVLLQQIEGNIIYPRVVGSSIGLPGIWVLAAVTVGGGVMGIVGMMLSVPLTATLYCIIRNDMNKK